MTTLTTPTFGADRRAAAILLPLFIVMSLVAYAGLVTFFGFPDVLRLPPLKILAAFRAEQTAVIIFYYLFAIAHLVFVAGVLALHRVLRVSDGPWLTIATAGGVLYGIAQTVGFLRWPILVPLFAEKAADPELTAGQLDALLLVLDAFHRYAGMAIGENLSFWGLAAWLIGCGVTVMRSPFTMSKAGWLWVIAGLMVAMYTFEQLGGPFAVLSPLLMLSHGLMYGLVLAIAWSLYRTADDDTKLRPVGLIAVTSISLFCAAIIVPGLI
ncbi:MAG: DUF4386 family protein [Oceanicoccus sp.]